ncbi:MAG: M60 family metallopeptidase, partial [Fimbriimonadaceae bacterium]|nr:M60 family metallopeptidase [Fimbriimonadaceae bacterium]
MLTIVLLLLGANASQFEQDLDALRQGVTTVAKPGLPGVVSAIAPDSVPFLVANEGADMVPVASAGRLGKGRVVAFGHGGYLTRSSASEGDTGRLLSNVLRWCAHREGAVRVGVVRKEDVGWVATLGFDAIELGSPIVPSALAKVDVVVAQAERDEPALDAYVRGGGALVTAHTPWGWMQLNPGKDLASQMPMQGLLHRAGLSFSDGYADRIRPPASVAEARRVNAGEALGRLAEDGALASSTVLAALRSTTSNEPFQRRLRTLIKETGAIYPTLKTPLAATDALPRLALAVRHFDQRTPRETATIEPGANDFPGPVVESAARVRMEVPVPLDRRQWVSTGLYAAPGETILVEVPRSLVDQGLSVQIGCHTDTLWHLDAWRRHPEITVRRAISAPITLLASGFGGPVYVVVERELKGEALVTIGNAVRAARYVHGKTTPEEWMRELTNPAPWAEIGSDRIVFTVPIEAARKVSDPGALMNLWDRTLGLYADLDGSPLFDRPERIVCDRQISAGYMHSGYPIMTWMDDSVPLSLDVKRLTTEGTWGHWHELGHNRQRSEWTFEGTGEVTNNLYTLYAMSNIAGKPLFDRIGKEKAKVDAYLAKGGDFAQWKREPFLALYQYGQLIEAFGWESLKAYFRSYQDPSQGPSPKTDAEKRDQFLVRYSRVVKRNLGPFFQAWGVPTSATARASVSDMPAWTPPRADAKD